MSELSCIKWVVALRPEAQAVIEKYRLERVNLKKAAYPVYTSRDGSVELVISGPGRLNAAGAAGYLSGVSSSESSRSGWINFGIAGSGRSEYGRTYLGNRIESDLENEAWYPTAVWPGKAGLVRRCIRTVAQPTEVYPQDGTLLEMEAAGYYPIALRTGSSEFCQVLKVVSDDPDHPIDRIDKPTVTGLCHGALEEADPWLGVFREMLQSEEIRQADPVGYMELVSGLRFTSTMQHQLRRLLQQLQALGWEGDLSEKSWKDGKECLVALRSLLEEQRTSFRDGNTPPASA